jgi:hypothetical protein
MDTRKGRAVGDVAGTYSLDAEDASTIIPIWTVGHTQRFFRIGMLCEIFKGEYP